MDTALDDTSLRILQQLLAHDSGALSVEELEYRNTDLEPQAIESNLSELETDGFVRKISADTPSDDLPSTYWTVTEFGVVQLKQGGIYEEISILAEADRALERTDRIKEIEEWEGRPMV